MSLTCEIRYGCGGLGDRLVGLVSAIMLADLSGRSLIIEWSSPSMAEIWDAVNGAPKPKQDHDEIVWNFIDQRFKYQALLESQALAVLWPSTSDVRLCGNQEIASFAYKNYPRRDFEADIQAVYQNLFSKYLVRPPPKLGRPELGIQLRCGDTHMRAGHVEYYSANTLRQTILPAIRDFIVTHDVKSVFLTSDFAGCAALLGDLLDASSTILMSYDNKLITHVDREGAQAAGLEKTVMDLETLASCKTILFSWVSNFGRVAALMSPPETRLYTLWGSEIYPVRNRVKLATKHESSRDELTAPVS